MRVLVHALAGEGETGSGEMRFVATEFEKDRVEAEFRLYLQRHLQLFRQQAGQGVFESRWSVPVLVIGGGAIAGDHHQLAPGLNPSQAVSLLASNDQQGQPDGQHRRYYPG